MLSSTRTSNKLLKGLKQTAVKSLGKCVETASTLSGHKRKFRRSPPSTWSPFL